ncbi:tRNA pseudouridine synthase A [Clostridium acetireducens DSM 10703]|jgi:tRNA pseudouridine38-40 synthase|uniref:tRNA pseudouridine synthase A n=1 Tax=Clostridium acetireducens DSM 10703 TaxID=1121290 RepID=A0A1E8F0C7_9CLOT|nr:tRNA pseudouridine(38-40) synthase TruA [Clostridium acetireducens]OFI06859.1 tRNA pseudouridine synthase A [Clostridium acetireducens DSM 10703]
MKNIKIIIEYDGTNYAGWQKQKNAITIQGVIERALEQISGKHTKINGCSRTDAGVHAKAFVASFLTESSIPEDKFKYALNSKLPEDILVLSSEEVPLDFHARYSSKGKTYSYTILNREASIAIGRNYVCHFKKPLDICAMEESYKYLIGTHDFSAFKSSGSSVKNNIRTITDINSKRYEDIIKINISANGFLYNMARIIVGTLFDVGTQKIKPEQIEFIMDSKDRRNAGISAPAKGLCLEKVFY